MCIMCRATRLMESSRHIRHIKSTYKHARVNNRNMAFTFFLYLWVEIICRMCLATRPKEDMSLGGRRRQIFSVRKQVCLLARLLPAPLTINDLGGNR